MNRDRRYRKHLLAGAALGALALGGPAAAADLKLPVKAPVCQTVFDWTGFYIGAHTGYGRGSSSAVLSDPAIASRPAANFSGMIGGVQAGYNCRLPSGLLLGVEADITFPNYLTSNSIVVAARDPRTDFIEQWDYVGTARGRIGYTSGPWLLYATGGFAWAGERFLNTPAVGDEEKHINVRLRLGRRRRRRIRLRAALERAARISLQPVRARQRPLSIRARNTLRRLDFQSLRIGLNRKVDWPGSPNWSPKTA